MPRLIYLVTEDWYFASHRLPLALAAQRAGYEVAVATRCGEHCRRIEAAGLRVIPFAMDRRGLSPLTLFREAFALARLYRRERPHLVHHVALRPVVVGGIAARLAGVANVIAAVTGMGFLFAGEGRAPLARRLLQKALPRLLARGLTVVQNPDDLALLRDCGVPAARLRLIPGAGVDVQAFAPAAEPGGSPIVLLASRLLWDKGVGEFVAAARRLRDRSARFVLVGGVDAGNPASVALADIQAWVKEGIVEWWGQREDMAEVLRQARAVCLPSYREGLPKVLLEAMASGRPCIATDVPGCREAVRHGDNGLLVPAKDSEALAAAIARLLDDPAEGARLGARGRERAVAEFGQERIVAATLELYRELLP